MRIIRPETIEADSSNYERAKVTKRQVKKFKLPDLNKCYQINIPDLRVTFYPRTLKRMKVKLQELKKLYPDREIICKEK